MVAKFLSGLDANLRPIRDSLLSSDNIPTLSRVLRVTTGSTDVGSSETSAMSARGRGCNGSRGRDRGRGTDTSVFVFTVIVPTMFQKNVGRSLANLIGPASLLLRRPPHPLLIWYPFPVLIMKICYIL